MAGIGERRRAPHRERDEGLALARRHPRGVHVQEQAELAPDQAEHRGTAAARQRLRAVTAQPQQGRGEAATQSVEPGLNR